MSATCGVHRSRPRRSRAFDHVARRSRGSAASCRRSRTPPASTERRLLDGVGRRVRVAVVDRVAGDAELDVVDAALDRRLLGLVALAEEHRDRDRGEDADDDDHDQQFDEGEAPRVPRCPVVSSLSPTAARILHTKNPRSHHATTGSGSVQRQPGRLRESRGFAPHPRKWFALCASTHTVPKYRFAGHRPCPLPDDGIAAPAATGTRLGQEKRPGRLLSQPPRAQNVTSLR